MKTNTREIGRGGRPAKFDEPSRPVTVTLPDRILERIKEIDDDRAKGIVKAVEAALAGAGDAPAEPVRKLRIANDESLLVVARSRLLDSVPWLRMVEIAPGRHLISLRDGVPIEKLEVTLEDLLDSNPDAGEAERNVLRTLLSRIRAPRRNQAVRKEEILVVRSLPKKKAAN